MGISVTNRPCERTIYYGEQRDTIQADTKANTHPARYTQDEVTISQMARDTLEKEGKRVDTVVAVDAVSKEHTFFSDFVIFQVVKWMFLIFHDFQFSCHIPGPSVCISHFSRILVISHFSSRQVNVSHFL